MSRLEILKNRVLWKIYAVWFFRRIVPLMVVQVALIALALQIFAQKVFVSMILQNTGAIAGVSYWSVLKYLLISFSQTRFTVQLVILVMLGVGALLIRDITRTIFTYKSMWRRS